MASSMVRMAGGRLVGLAIGRGALAMVAGTALAAPSALAQQAPATAQPYVAVVTGEKAMLLCYNTETSYAVAELKSGAVVRVVSEGPRWSQVAYPAGLTAFVRADEVVVEGGQVKLTKASQLRAAIQAGGFARSWKALFPPDQQVPAGTTLKLAENPEEKDNGVVVAYRVRAPEGAKGWVDSRSLRRATEAEAQAAGFAPEALAAAKIDKPAPKPGSEPKPDPKPEVVVSRPAEAPAKTTLADPMVPPPGAAKGATGEATKVIASPAKPAERKLGTVEDLESMFQEVKKTPLNAEVDELVAEYQRVLDATPADSVRRRQQIEQRLAVLKTMKDYRETLRRREAEAQQLDAGQRRVQDAVGEFERQRIYTMVGVLQPSTVYDGKRLPLMFRVQSVGGMASRTLGYIKPTPELRLETKLGQVVGVIGESQLDPALKLNVINAVRVDQMRPSDAPVAPTTQTPIHQPPSQAPTQPSTQTGPQGVDHLPAREPAEAPSGMTPVPPAPGGGN